MTPEDARLVLDALAGLKEQAENAHIEAMACRALLTGLALSLRSRIPSEILDEAFENALASLAGASNRLAQDGVPFSGALAAHEIVESIRELVLPSPKLHDDRT